MLEEQGLCCIHCNRSVHYYCYNKDISRCALMKKPDINGAAIEAKEYNIPHRQIDYDSKNITLLCICYSFKPCPRGTPSHCDHCGKILWGKDCYKCTVCHLIAHKKCCDKFPSNCGVNKEMNETLLKIQSGKENGLGKNSVTLAGMDNHEVLENFADMLKNLKSPKDETDQKLQEFKHKISNNITKGYHYKQVQKESKFEDFQLLKVLGEGNFGKVFLVETVENRDVLAMKVLDKEEIIRGNDVEIVMNERKVFEYGKKSSFLVALHSTFQSSDKLFFVMEFLPGGDLLFHITTNGRFTSDQARFYAAEIYLAINFLHQNKIIHRDLKPENILLDKNSHIKLIDFGVSKLGVEREKCTRTHVGTASYQAPEILKAYHEGKGGYTISVDWWSYGVVLYEVK